MEISFNDLLAGAYFATIAYKDSFERQPPGASPTYWTKAQGTYALQVAKYAYTAGAGGRCIVPVGKSNLDVNTLQTNLGASTSWDIRYLATVNNGGANPLGANPTGADAFGPVLRFSGTTGYVFTIRWNNNAIDLWKQVSGVYTELQQGTNNVTSYAQNEPVWIRASSVGTTIQAKIWRVCEDEPTAWTISVTDSAISGSGYPGLIVCNPSGGTVLQPNASAIWVGLPTVEYVPPIKYQVLVTGNSIAAGYTTTTAWSAYLADALGPEWCVFNQAVTGQTTTQMIANDTAKVDFRINDGLLTTILIAQEIRNDIAQHGYTAAQAYANWVSYCQARRAAGHLVITVPVLPSSFGDEPAGYEATRQQVNAMLAANWPSFCDGFCYEVLTDTALGVSSAQNNATYYYSDKTHLTAAGQARLARWIREATLRAVNRNSRGVNLDTTASNLASLNWAYAGRSLDAQSTPLPVSAAGSSAVPCTITINNGSGAIPGANVWIKSADGSTVVAGVMVSDGQGKVHTLLIPGVTYLLYATATNENPIDGQSFVAVAD